MRIKTVAFLPVLCLALSLCAAALAAPGDILLFPPDPDGGSSIYAESIAAVDDTLYVLGNGGLYAWRTGETQPRLLSDAVRAGSFGRAWDDLAPEEREQYQYQVGMLLGSGGQLYGLDTSKGSLLFLSVGEQGIQMEEAAVLDWDGMYIKEFEYAYPRQIYGAALSSGRLYLLVQESDEHWENCELLSFDLKSGTRETLAVKNVHAIAAYEGGALLCTVYNWDKMYASDGRRIMPALCVLDPVAQSLTKLADFPAGQVGGLAYDAAGGMVYVLGKGILYACKVGGPFEKAAYIPMDYPGDSTKAVFLSGGMYAALSNESSIYVRNIDPAFRSERVLRIAGGYSDNLAQAFRAANPDIPVLFVEGGYNSAEQIAQQMVSGSESADLFAVSLSYGGFTALRDKGYAGDLSGSTLLKEAVSKMYPRYVKELFREGRLIAFPQRFDCYALGYSPEVLKDLGIGRPPRTFFELMDLYVDWVEKYADAYPQYTLNEYVSDARTELLNNILMGYLAHYAKSGENLQFDTPLFRKLLQKLDELSPIIRELNPKDGQQGGTITVSGDTDTPSSLLANIGLYPMSYNDSRGYRLLPLALDEGMEPVYFAQITVLVLNPNSSNREMAMKYLEYCAQNMPRYLSITFCPGDNAPVEDPNYTREAAAVSKRLEEMRGQLETAPPEARKSLETSIKDQEEYLAYWEKHRFSVSPELIAQYRDMVPYIVVDTQNIELLTRSRETLTLLQRFLQGEMKSEQFLREFDRKLQMIRMESN